MSRPCKKVLPATARRVTAALNETGGHQREAAKRLGISPRRIQSIIKLMRDTGHEVPKSPHDLSSHYRPNQAQIYGTSTLLDAEGNVKQQWVKEKATAPSPEEMAKVFRLALEDMPRVPAIKPPARTTEGLMCVYPMGDPHIGMYSWADETGEDFDLNIAQRNLTNAVAHLVGCCPPSERALIVNVGDFFHADNMENRTMRSGNVLDVDTRWAKVLRVGVNAMRACIEYALRKHQSVHVINEIGNHDDHSSQMLTLALSMFYEDNPRVTFDESPGRFHYYRFGKNLIGVTHGDNTKLEALGQIMATDRHTDWGATEFRYWYTGHIHHRRMLEMPGCVAESFRTLAARDAWHSGKGYRSGRDMCAIVLDADAGEVQRYTIGLSSLEKMYGGKAQDKGVG